MFRAPSRKSARERGGTLIVVGLWLGPAAGPYAAKCVRVICPRCDAECAIQPQNLCETRGEWRTDCRRDDAGVVQIDTRYHVREWSCRSRCLGCGEPWVVRIIGRLVDPWQFGPGLIHRMPNFPAAADESEQGGQP